MVVTYVRGTGRLSLDRYDFVKHIDGTDFRQKASTIDTDLTYTGLGNATTVKEALDWLNTHGSGGGGGPGIVDLSDLGATTGILPIVRGGTGLGAIGGSGTVLTSNGTAASWQTIVNANIATSAGIVVTKLAAAGTNGFVLNTTGGIPTWAAITNTNIASGAAIAVTKLAAGSDNTVLTSSGGATGWTSIVDANVASGANIAVNKLASGTNGFVLTTVGGNPAWAAATGGGGGSDVDLYGPTIQVDLDENGIADSLDEDGYPAGTIIISTGGNHVRGIRDGQALSSRRLVVKISHGGIISAFSDTSDLDGDIRIRTDGEISLNYDDALLLWWGDTATEEAACWGPVRGGASGEANTTSNVGSGAGLALSKDGINLPFKSLIGGTAITLTQNANDVTINTSAEANTASNVGAGAGLFTTKSGTNLPFKSLVAGTNITLTPSSDSITVSSAGGSGEVNTASSLGGNAWVASKVGVDLRFFGFQTIAPLTSSTDGSSRWFFQLGGLSGYGTAGQAMRTNSGSTGLEWYTPSAGGGSPAGTTGEPQINSSGSFGVPGSMLMGSGYISMGSTVSSIGRLRTPNNSGIPFIAQRNSANSGDLVALAGSTATLYVGSNSNLTSPFTNVQIYPSTQLSLGIAGTTSIEINPTNTLFINPRLGLSSPYGDDGEVTVSTAISGTISITPTQYSRKNLYLVSTANGNAIFVFPPASNADSVYDKWIEIDAISPEGNTVITISNGGAATVVTNTAGPGPGYKKRARIKFSSGGAFQTTAWYVSSS